MAELTSLAGGNEHRVHEVIRALRDEDRIHADRGYWVLGSSKERRW